MEIKEYIEGEINENLSFDGGGCEFISYENGVVNIKLTGHCTTCPHQQITLKEGIEVTIKDKYPEVVSVINI